MESIAHYFASCTTQEQIYERIIELGREKARFDEAWKVDEKLVKGCQSQVFLHSEYEDKSKRFIFYSFSDALISAGLARLLCQIYAGQSAKTILTCEPKILETLGISESLSPSRANGLASMYLHMKKLALEKYLQEEAQNH